MQTLKGRTCVFTGATAGDGREVVKALCLGGMNVIVMTHNYAEANTLIDEVKASGATGVCTFFEGNRGRKAEEDTDFYDQVVERFGSIDVCIHNGGGNGHIDDIETLTEEELMREVQHLAGGAFGMMRTAIPYLKKSKAPRVIFMTSTEGIRGSDEGSFACAVGKGAVASLTLNAAARLLKYGITVNCIAKGAIPRIEGVRPGDFDPTTRLHSIPMGRLGTSNDLAGAVCFLASEESSYITGQIIELSGGLNIGR